MLPDFSPLRIGSVNLLGMDVRSPKLYIDPLGSNGRFRASEAIAEIWSWKAGCRKG